MIETAGALLVDRGRLLLGLGAPHKSFPGCWAFIGGHVEPGETVWAALYRELAEEVGVEALSVEPLETLEYAYATGRASLLHAWSLSHWRGEPAIRNAEHAALRWFGFGETQRLPNLALPHHRRLFASL